MFGWGKRAFFLVALVALSGGGAFLLWFLIIDQGGARTDVVRQGENLYRKECASCHGPTGERLPLAPLSSKDFLASRGDATLMAVITGGKGIMPAFGSTRDGPFSDKEVQAVVAFLNHKAGRESASILAQAGGDLFSSQCAKCHGPQGDRIPIVPLSAKGFLDMRTNADLKEAIRVGKGPMPAFGINEGGKLTEEDIRAIVAFLRHRVEEQTALTASRGRDLYVGNCLQCHGAEGDRIPGSELASPLSLQSLGDGAIITAINQGTGVMPGFGTTAGGSMGIPDIASLLTYLKTWAGISATSALASPTLFGQGKDMFLRNCTGCHRETGDGVPGVRLLSKEFLARETDEVVLQTITRGNAKGMPAWGVEAGGPLTQAQIQSILDFLKSTAVSEAVSAPGANQGPLTAEPTPTVSVPMSQQAIDRGREIFLKGTCTTCHGETRDKIPTCKLAEADFLRSQGDATLINSITFGKGAMPAWGLVKGGPLSPDDVQAVVAFLKNAAGLGAVEETSPSNSAPSVDLVAKGKTLFTNTCAMCHGESRDKITTCKLADPEWLKAKGFDGVIKDATEGKPPMMPAWGKAKGGPLSPADILAVVTYLWDSAGLGNGNGNGGEGVKKAEAAAP
ncbi:MAG: c-type cytochrome, partial [Chloroflexi bacterium]|nr:c-type cytochrome [Chloroflexota bacterium]